MGMIRNRGGAERLLAECTVLGRAPTCDICVNAHEISTEHAALRWIDRRWHLVDLNSRNGSWVNGQRVSAGEAVALDTGDLLCLGGAAEVWVVADAGPPRAFLRGPQRDVPVNQGMLALPSDDDPQLVVLKRSDGSWIAEAHGEQRPAEDRESLWLGDQRYRLYLPCHLPPTAVATGTLLRVEDAELLIQHDGTEEHVVAKLKPPWGGAIDLGSRAHNAVLLELARARLEDRERGIVEAEEGWLHRDDLSKRLNLPVNHVNIMVHRLRKQLADSGVVDAADVVERRARSGLMRVGTPTVSVGRI